MMKLRRSITLIISLLTLFPLYKLVQACADIGDPYDTYASFFPPSVSNKPAYLPFYYQGWLKYYTDWYEAPEADPVPDANIAEWQRYAGGNIPLADLDSFIYRYSYADLKSLYYHLEQNEPLKVASAVSGNNFTKWFMTGKDLEALGYLMHAKQCEPYATSGSEWEQPQADTAKMSRLIKNAQQLHAAAKKDFIKEKYAFQAIRMAYYAGRPQQALDLFNQLIGTTAGSSYTYVRCLGLKAGALFRLKNKTEAAYWYSRVFDLSDGMKQSAYLSFDWSIGQDATPVLKLCKNNHERAVVYVMDGLHEYEYGLPTMQSAYEADPQVDGLDVLMTREINKIEERYQEPALSKQRNVSGASWYYNSYSSPTDMSKWQETKTKYEKYTALLNSFAQKVAAEGKQGHKAFWYLSSAYLYFIQQNIPDYKRQLELAAKEKMNPKERDVYDVLQVLYTIRNTKEISPSIEAALLPQLRSLKQRPNQKAFRDVMTMILTTAYLQQHDTVRAIYALARSSGYIDDAYMDLPGSLLENMTTDKLQEVKAFVQKSNKSDYERWLLDSNRYDIGRLQELEGTKYLRQHQFDKAVAALGKTQEVLLLPDPFIDYLQDTQDLTPDDTVKMYSKLSFAKEMVALEKKLPAGDAATLFRYATGLYSMTYYGKAHSAYTYYRSSVDGFAYFNGDERKALPAYAQDYYGALTAEQYYLKAAEKAGNAELKAKCIFMAAKCWQKRTPSREQYIEYKNQDEYFVNALRNPYFKQLKDGYKNTRLYQEAYGTCDYFKTYVTRNK